MDADDDLLDVNCGRCGKRLRVRFDELQDLRTIDCEDCNKLPPREPPTSDGHEATGGIELHSFGEIKNKLLSPVNGIVTVISVPRR